MTTVTESDLKELKDLILGIDRKLDVYIARTDERFNTLDERFKAVDRRFDQVDKRIDDTKKRIDSINARLNTFTLGFLSIVGVLVTGLLGIIGKLVFYPNP